MGRSDPRRPFLFCHSAVESKSGKLGKGNFLLSEAIAHSVHTQETTAQFVPNSNYRAYSDQFIRHKMKFVSNVYSDLERNPNSKKVFRLANCRSQAYFMRHEDTGLLRIASSHCHLRWCPLCATTRRNFIAGQTKDWLQTVNNPKLLTLTLKHSDESLSDQVDRIYDSFRQLRKRSLLRQSIKGGMWFFQVTQSKDGKQWHPHIHALIDSCFMPHAQLKALWLAITGDSTIVDIRPIKDRDATSLHVARYAAAPCDLTSFSPGEAVEIVRDLKGRRLCGTWGSGRQISLRPHKPDDSDKWKRFGSWLVVCEQAKTDPSARVILDAWKNNKPIAAAFNFSHYDDFISDPDRETWGRGPPKTIQPYLAFY